LFETVTTLTDTPIAMDFTQDYDIFQFIWTPLLPQTWRREHFKFRLAEHSPVLSLLPFFPFGTDWQTPVEMIVWIASR